MNFSTLYEAIEFDLRQIDDSKAGFAGMNRNSSKPLPKEHAKRLINESIVKILRESHSINQAVVLDHTFTYDTSILEVDNAIFIYAIKSTNGEWENISDTYSVNNNLRMVNSSTIENPRGWKEGDEIQIQLILMPVQIVNDTDPISWNERDIDLLRKTVVIEVSTILNTELNTGYYQDRQNLMMTFVSNNRLNHVTKMHKMHGANIGRIGR